MVLDISEEQFLRMRAAVYDTDAREAIVLLKEFVKRLEQQHQAGMKSHLGG